MARKSFALYKYKGQMVCISLHTPNWWGIKNFIRKSFEKGQKILILEGWGLYYGRKSIFPEEGQRIFWENENNA